MQQNYYTFHHDDIKKKSHVILAAYEKYGIIHIENFLQPSAIQNLLNDLSQATDDAVCGLEKFWQNEKVYFYSRCVKTAPVIESDYATHPYFLSSKDKVHVFFEKDDEALTINRIGHGLHLDSSYRYIQSLVYHNPQLHGLLRLVGLRHPVCLLSVYIPKYPNNYETKIRPHQESTFAYTEPQTATVLWIALEDAYIDNACMWGILGSHRSPLRYISSMNHHNKTRIFSIINETQIPDFNRDKCNFTPLIARGGDALIFHGNFIHCSPSNHSKNSRRALSMQFIDTNNTYYPSTNWIYPRNNHHLY